MLCTSLGGIVTIIDTGSGTSQSQNLIEPPWSQVSSSFSLVHSCTMFWNWPSCEESGLGLGLGLGFGFGFGFGLGLGLGSLALLRGVARDAPLHLEVDRHDRLVLATGVHQVGLDPIDEHLGLGLGLGLG